MGKTMNDEEAKGQLLLIPGLMLNELTGEALLLHLFDGAALSRCGSSVHCSKDCQVAEKWVHSKDLASD
jgi:hypothetical protein